MYIGICNVDEVVSTSHYTGEKSSGWGYLSIDGKKVHKQISKGYGIKYGKVGDRIGVRLDCDVGQLSFSVNNVDQGVAFHSSSLKSSNLTIGVSLFCPGQSVSVFTRPYDTENVEFTGLDRSMEIKGVETPESIW